MQTNMGIPTTIGFSNSEGTSMEFDDYSMRIVKAK